METEVQNDIMTYQSSLLVDNSIERRKLISFIPQSKADINRSTGKIEIDIPACDAYYIPSQSYIQIDGRLVRGDKNNAYDANAQIALANNAVMYLFQNIEYCLGGVSMDVLRNPGHTTSMLGYLSYPDDFNAGLNQCWRKDTNINAISAEYRFSGNTSCSRYTYCSR